MRLAWVPALGLLAAACGPDESTSACKDDFVAGDLVVTEVFADFAAPEGGAGTDDGKEWFEIYNNSERPVSLKGVSVVHSRPDGMSPKTHSMDDVTIAPGQYFTLGNSTADLLPPYVDYGFAADLGAFYNTGGGKLALKCGDQLIDEAIYDNVKSGRSRQLTSQSVPDYTLNDDPVNWCEARTTQFEASNYGTPGDENDCAPVISGACSDNGVMRPVVSPAVGELVITEWMSKPSSPVGANGQWFEVKALAPVDLNGLGLDRVGDSSAPTIFASAECVHLEAGSYAVFARTLETTTNGGVTAVGTFPFSINPSSDPGDVRILIGDTELDAITWMRADTLNGRSRSLDPDFTSATANDDAGAFCSSEAVYNADNGDRGTPGQANEECPLQPVPGQCLDGGTLRDIKKPAAEALVITEYLANPAGTDSSANSGQEWFEIKNTSGAEFDLNELLMQDGGATMHPINYATCKSVAPNGYALFARSGDAGSNGGLPAVDVTFTFAINNGAEKLQLFDGATLLDKVEWSSSLDGRSRQLKLSKTNVTDNDNQANFCDAEQVQGQQYGTPLNYGTPRAENIAPDVCP